MIEATPRLFTLSALDFDFDPAAVKPEIWLNFLDELWPGDPQSIATLQEWIGYLLTADTRLQKILLLVGPGRSGKGTIARVVHKLVGPENVAGPTLSSLTTQFGLWPLIGKSVVIISDARLSGRSDRAVIVERLLSISGEDALTIDRKEIEPVTCKLNTRLIILTNELPRLSDASGALASRFIVLRLIQSFLGREDHDLLEKLLPELPAILLWAIEGWRRLRERDRFIQPESGLDLANDLCELSSPVGAFVREQCNVGPEHTISRQSLYQHYHSWAQGRGREHFEDEAGFGKAIRAVVPTIGDSHPRVNGVKIRHYTGIGIK